MNFSFFGLKSLYYFALKILSKPKHNNDTTSNGIFGPNHCAVLGISSNVIFEPNHHVVYRRQGDERDSRGV